MLLWTPHTYLTHAISHLARKLQSRGRILWFWRRSWRSMNSWLKLISRTIQFLLLNLVISFIHFFNHCILRFLWYRICSWTLFCVPLNNADICKTIECFNTKGVLEVQSSHSHHTPRLEATLSNCSGCSETINTILTQLYQYSLLLIIFLIFE